MGVRGKGVKWLFEEHTLENPVKGGKWRFKEHTLDKSSVRGLNGFLRSTRQQTTVI